MVRQSEKEDDMQDKLTPTISYLQKLGPEHLEQIFKSARWVFEMNQDMAFEVIQECSRLNNLLIERRFSPLKMSSYHGKR